MRGTDRGTYTRIAESLIRCRLKRRPLGHFDGVHFEIGTQSQHRAAQSRMWRTFWRIKLVGDRS
jgi:hypothetical protein